MTQQTTMTWQVGDRVRRKADYRSGRWKWGDVECEVIAVRGSSIVLKRVDTGEALHDGCTWWGAKFDHTTPEVTPTEWVRLPNGTVAPVQQVTAGGAKQVQGEYWDPARLQAAQPVAPLPEVKDADTLLRIVDAFLSRKSVCDGPGGQVMSEPMVTFTGQVTLAEAKRLVAEAEAKVKAQPMYLTIGRYALHNSVYRVQPDGTTHYVGPDGEWAPLGYSWPLERTTNGDIYGVTEADAVRQQQARRPKPAWTPQVGEWVVVNGVNTFARKVTRIEGTRHYLDYNGREGVCGFEVSELRPATDAEIAEAKRIKPKAYMLLKESASGCVWRCMVPPSAFDCGQWQLLDGWSCYSGPRSQFTTDHYTVLDSYVVQGAR